MTRVVPVSFYFDDFEWNGWSKSETGILRSNIDNERVTHTVPKVVVETFKPHLEG